jgi:hypothetical protein
MRRLTRSSLPLLLLIVSVLCLLVAARAQDPDPSKSALPKTLTVTEVKALLEKSEMTGQGCGACTWNGESWGFYANDYKPLKLPWTSEPRIVYAGFAFGRMPVEHHLIEFRGSGFRYRRTTDVPELTLVPDNEPK